MAYYPDCFEKMEASWQEGEKTKRRRGKKKEGVKETGGLATGTCDNHMLGDLRDMTAQEDNRYSASARNNSVRVQHVAKTCWDCGVQF